MNALILKTEDIYDHISKKLEKTLIRETEKVSILKSCVWPFASFFAPKRTAELPVCFVCLRTSPMAETVAWYPWTFKGPPTSGAHWSASSCALAISSSMLKEWSNGFHKGPCIASVVRFAYIGTRIRDITDSLGAPDGPDCNSIDYAFFCIFTS